MAKNYTVELSKPGTDKSLIETGLLQVEMFEYIKHLTPGTRMTIELQARSTEQEIKERIEGNEHD